MQQLKQSTSGEIEDQKKEEEEEVKLDSISLYMHNFARPTFFSTIENYLKQTKEI